MVKNGRAQGIPSDFENYPNFAKFRLFIAVARLATLTRGDYDRVRHDEAANLGWRVETLDAEVQKARVAARVVDDADVDRPPEFTDEALALRFTALHKDRLRYVVTWGRWLIWDGAVWRFDDTMRAFDLARAICRQAAGECNKPKVASMIASAKTVAAVERLAKADRRHAATVDQWDAMPWLLNTHDGVVDLRTGQMHRHRPDGYMTKTTADRRRSTPTSIVAMIMRNVMTSITSSAPA
jgi:putative DNA primase/helicase